MAESTSQPLTIDLPVRHQSLNVDLESIAPIRGFKPDESYDLANMTVTALVESPSEQIYRLVLRCDVEAGTRAFARVVSADDDRFDIIAPFERIKDKDSQIVEPVLAKAGIAAGTDSNALREIAKGFKVAELKIPQGSHVVRIHASQKLVPQDDSNKSYSLVIYAPLLSFNLAAGATKLSASVVFPQGFEMLTTISDPVIEPIPGQPEPQPDASFNQTMACQRAMAWCFHVDPKITINYKYN